MDLVQRHARFIGEIAFPQAVRADNVQCPAFTFCCQAKLTALRFEQTLRLHVFDETRHFVAREVQRSRDGFRRGMPALIFTVEQMFERIFHLFAFLRRAPCNEDRNGSHAGSEDREQ